MRKDPIATYVPWLGVPEPGKSRCCITGEDIDTEGLRCGHIVPRFLSEDLMGYLGGVAPAGVLGGRFNGLVDDAL